MKSLIRWSATLGVVGSVLLGSLFTAASSVLALTNEQVMERLESVPVFTLTDDQGSPLVASPPDGSEGPPVAGVFISQQDAQSFLENLRTDNPQLAESVQVVPVSLAEVYELAVGEQGNQGQLEFAFIPMRQQVEAATSVLQESGQNPQEFEGVPLFLARSGGENGGYLTIQQGEEQAIPIFFTQEELQAMLTRLQQSQPDLASNIEIQVVNLEGLIDTLQNSDNQELTQIVLVPPRESLEYIRSLQPGAGQSQPQQTAPEQ